jgi:hypothetical protein
MAALHKGHGGITKMRKLAQELYYWPGIANDIKMMVDGCKECQERPREPAAGAGSEVRATGLGLGHDRHGPIRARGQGFLARHRCAERVSVHGEDGRQDHPHHPEGIGRDFPGIRLPEGDHLRSRQAILAGV